MWLDWRAPSWCQCHVEGLAVWGGFAEVEGREPCGHSQIVHFRLRRSKYRLERVSVVLSFLKQAQCGLGLQDLESEINPPHHSPGFVSIIGPCIEHHHFVDCSASNRQPQARQLTAVRALLLATRADSTSHHQRVLWLLQMRLFGRFGLVERECATK